MGSIDPPMPTLEKVPTEPLGNVDDSDFVKQKRHTSTNLAGLVGEIEAYSEMEKWDKSSCNR